MIKPFIRLHRGRLKACAGCPPGPHLASFSSELRDVTGGVVSTKTQRPDVAGARSTLTRCESKRQCGKLRNGLRPFRVIWHFSLECTLFHVRELHLPDMWAATHEWVLEGKRHNNTNTVRSGDIDILMCRSAGVTRQLTNRHFERPEKTCAQGQRPQRRETGGEPLPRRVSTC